MTIIEPLQSVIYGLYNSSANNHNVLYILAFSIFWHDPSQPIRNKYKEESITTQDPKALDPHKWA